MLLPGGTQLTRKDKVREVDWSCGTVGLWLAKAKAADTAMALIEEEVPDGRNTPCACFM